MTLFYLFQLFILLQLKHLIVDFVLQTDKQAKAKGIYGNLIGISHSLEHLIGTLIVCVIMFNVVSPMAALGLALFDFITHYHIDFLKMRYGCRDFTKSAFWAQLGLDQFSHQMVYIIIVQLAFLKLYC